MSTSAHDVKMNLLGSIAGAAFLALFGSIYELFSHGVYSYYMVCAFAIPLALGALPYSLFLLLKKRPGRAAYNLWNSGIAALSTGCVFRGVLEIYGTTNSLSIVYPVSGCILLAAGVIAWIAGTAKSKEAS